MRKVFVIILNYRRFKDTVGCVETIRKSDLPEGVKFVIVDNSEDDVSVEHLRRRFPKIKLIKAEENLGFAGGNNLGIKYALEQGADFVLIINPDVKVEKNFLRPLMVDLEKKGVGLVAPAHRHRQKGLVFYGLGGSVDWSTGKCTHENKKGLGEGKLVKCEFVSFACVLIKREVFERVGLLDERYFMYLEDVDFCTSAGRVGFGSFLDSRVVVDHATSSSFKRPTEKLKYSFVSQLKLVNKWLPLVRRVRPFLFTLGFYPYLYLLWSYHGLKYR